MLLRDPSSAQAIICVDRLNIANVFASSYSWCAYNSNSTTRGYLCSSCAHLFMYIYMYVLAAHFFDSSSSSASSVMCWVKNLLTAVCAIYLREDGCASFKFVRARIGLKIKFGKQTHNTHTHVITHTRFLNNNKHIFLDVYKKQRVAG